MTNVAGLDSNSRRALSALSNAGDGTIVNLYADPITHRLLTSATSTANLIVGTSTITSGTNTYIEYNNNGVLGEYSLSGTGTVVAMATSPTFQTSINGAYLTASQILITDGSSNIISAAVATYPSLTELTYLKGVTSAIQTQINAKGVGTVTAVSIATANGFSGSSSGGATPALTIVAGAIIPTSVNGNTFTTGTYTLTGASGKTLTFNNSITIAGTDSTTMTFPSTSATIARTDATQTFTGTQTFTQVITTANTVTVTSNAGTIPVTSYTNNFTNSSASAMTITLATTSAVDGQRVLVRIYDATGVAKGITWVNTENSANTTAPANSSGSTMIPLTVGFAFNGVTSKWTCLAFS